MMYDNPPYYLSAYGTAVKWGFEGTEEQWLESLTAYGQAVKEGYEGTVQQWLESLTAYGQAVKEGYEGTVQQWLDSLTAYGQAVKAGFEGTLEQWLDSLVGPKGDPFTYEDFTPEQLEGLRGEGFVISGCYESLEQIQNPKVGENYYIGVAAPYDVYSLTVNGWVNGGSFKGDPGQDGYTPVRGLDYWTENDKTEIVSEVNRTMEPVLAAAAKIETGSYVGTGTSGAGRPNTLTFAIAPKMVIIYRDIYSPVTYGTYQWGSSYQVFLKGASSISVAASNNDGYSGYTYFTFDGTSFSWYNNGIYYTAQMQMNVENVTYHYIAIG